MKKRFKPNFHFSAAGDLSGGGGGALTAEQKIVNELKNQITEAVRGISQSEDIKSTIVSVFNDQILKGMDLTQIRSYKDNEDKIKADISDMASKLEKIEQRGLGNIVPSIKADGAVIKEAINKRFSEIENVLKSRNPNMQFTLEARAASVMDTTNIITESDDIPEDLIDSFSLRQFVEKRRDREFIFDIADRTTVNDLVKNLVWMSEGDAEGAFAIVAEGGLKPLVSVGLTRNFSEAQKVAGRSVYTDEVPKFKKEAYKIIRRLINDKLVRDYQSMLTTSLLAIAPTYVSSALDGQYANPTDYHAIAAGAAQIEAVNFMPDILILNPQDKWRIGMSQDSSGAFYLAIPTVSPEGEQRILGFRVITSNKIPVGKFILGEAGLWKVEDETITIKIGYGVENIYDTEDPTKLLRVEDDLSHNRFRVISELWFHSYIDSLHTGSFIYGDFATIKEALTEPAAPGEG